MSQTINDSASPTITPGLASPIQGSPQNTQIDASQVNLFREAQQEAGAGWGAVTKEEPSKTKPVLLAQTPSDSPEPSSIDWSAVADILEGTDYVNQGQLTVDGQAALEYKYEELKQEHPRATLTPTIVAQGVLLDVLTTQVVKDDSVAVIQRAQEVQTQYYAALL